MGLFEVLLGHRFPFKFVYSNEYWMVNIGRHVFPVKKYRQIYEKLVAMGARKENFLIPEPTPERDLLLVHTPRYLEKLRSGTLSKDDLQTLELPFTPELLHFALLHVGGTLLAARQALEDGLCVHLGGGFHHAFPDHGEGFCVLNDVAVAIESLLRDGRIAKAMVVDCDVHQGNGTAAVLGKAEGVFTFSIHQMDIYPAQKPPSTLDVGLWSGEGDEAYLDALHEHFPRLFREFKPGLVIYLAGVDPLGGDRLGGLSLSKEGLVRRDRLILEGARRLGIPVAIVLGGGYAHEPADTVAAHLNTIRIATAVQRRIGPGERPAGRPPSLVRRPVRSKDA